MKNLLPDRALGAQSIERAVAILRIVATAGSEGLKLSDVVTRSALARGTVHRMLLALIREGLVEQDARSKLYYLGPEIYVLGTLVSERYGIHTLAQPALSWLAEVSEDTAFLSVLRGHEIVCMSREEGTYPIKAHVLKAGDRHPLGVSSAGQAVLAALDDQQVEEVLAANAEIIKARYPRYSPTHVRTLIADARKSGFSVDEGLIWPGSWSIGIAVLSPTGMPVGALSISTIQSRMTLARQKELVRHLRLESKWLTDQLSRLQTPKRASRKRGR
jgi:DNA-binding IclR family transcriptional regulator